MPNLTRHWKGSAEMTSQSAKNKEVKADSRVASDRIRSESGL